MSAPYPTGYSHTFSYSGYEAVNPSTPKPGLNMDAELQTIALAINSIIAALADVRRSDGPLVNGLVTMDSLSSVVKTSIGGWNPRGVWTTGTAYGLKDMVRAPNSGSYVCIVAHTAGATFAGDQATKWAVVSPWEVGAQASIQTAGTTGKVLQSTGSDSYAWVDPSTLATNVSIGGQAGVFYWTATGLNMIGSRIQTEQDGFGQFWLSSAVALSLAPDETILNPADNLAYGYHVDAYGRVDACYIRTRAAQATLSGSHFTVSNFTNGNNVTLDGNAGFLFLTSATGNPTLALWDGTVHSGQDYNWTIAYDQGSHEFQVVPIDGNYNAYFGAHWSRFGTSVTVPPAATYTIGGVSLAFNLAGGIISQDVYSKGAVGGGTGSTPTWAVYGGGDAFFNSVTATGMVIAGQPVRAAGQAINATGSVVEIGPISTGSTSTADFGVNMFLMGLRTDSTGVIYLRAKALAIT